MIHLIAAAITIGLVVIGTALAGLAPDWRRMVIAVGLQYAGVALLLSVSSGIVAGLTTAILAGGIIAVLRFVSSPDAETEMLPLSTESPAATGDELLASFSGRPSLRRPRSGAMVGRGVRIRVFDLTVIALAIVGAGEVALTHPLFGDVAMDVCVDVLLLVGLLYCLLPRPARVAAGVLFIASSGSLALNAADPARTPGELVGLAAAQLALAIGLAYLRDAPASASDPDGEKIPDDAVPTEPRPPVRRNPPRRALDVDKESL